MHTNNIVELAVSQQTDTATFNLVGELLAEALAGDEEELIIESRSQDFFYDPGIHTADEPLLKATVDYEDVAEIEDKINVNLFGTVEGLHGRKVDFTLYFLMWCSDTANVLPENCSKTLLESSPVEIELNECLNGFSNTVFEVALYRKNKTCEPSSLGHGRGFLVFDEST